MCRFCGLSFLLHEKAKEKKNGMIEGEDMKGTLDTIPIERLESVGWKCTSVSESMQMVKMPLLDIRCFSQAPLEHRPSHTITTRPINLVACADPAFTSGIWALVRQMNPPSLESFAEVPCPSDMHILPIYPIDSLGGDRTTINSMIAPYALMAILGKIFIKHIVQSGIEIARADRGFLKVSNKKVGNTVSLLTPTHILRGTVDRGYRRRTALDISLFECLSRVGAIVDMNSMSTILDQTPDDHVRSANSGSSSCKSACDVHTKLEKI